MFGADGEKIAVQPPSPVAGPVSIKGPVLLYELVKPVFQQIFLPLRSASVTGAAKAHTD
jgi:hypothetical protein